MKKKSETEDSKSNGKIETWRQEGKKDWIR